MAEPEPEHDTVPAHFSQPASLAAEPDNADATYEPVRPEETDWVVEEADWDSPERTFDLVRPYSWTRGRTTGCHALAVEALVSATSAVPHPAASAEHQAILGLCQTPRSVAELAALLSVPLGVARMVLGDMAEAGSVVVHRTAGATEGGPDLALMQRVLTCLQRL